MEDNDFDQELRKSLATADMPMRVTTKGEDIQMKEQMLANKEYEL